MSTDAPTVSESKDQRCGARDPRRFVLHVLKTERADSIKIAKFVACKFCIYSLSKLERRHSDTVSLTTTFSIVEKHRRVIFIYMEVHALH